MEAGHAPASPSSSPPAAGADRTVLAFICDAYDEEEITNEKGKTETRVVMHFHPRIAPAKVGVFPLLKNKPELVAKAMEVRAMLQPHMTVVLSLIHTRRCRRRG